MKKRATDSTVLKTIGGRASRLSSALCPRTLFTCTVVALALGGGATPAHAVSGENEDTEGAFHASCQDLRNETNFPGGDEIFVCDSGGRACRLIDLTDLTDLGVGYGACDDSIESIVPDRGDDVEPDVPIDAATFGSVTGLTGSTGDIFCEAFESTTTPSRATKVCIRISQGNCTPGTAGGSIDVRCSSCETVADLLTDSVAVDPPNLRWFLFNDSEKAGQPRKSGVVALCPGNKWTSLPLSGATIVTGVTVNYQADLVLIQTPHYVTISGRRYCKKVAGEIPTHTCP